MNLFLVGVGLCVVGLCIAAVGMAAIFMVGGDYPWGETAARATTALGSFFVAVGLMVVVKAAVNAMLVALAERLTAERNAAQDSE